MGLGWYALIVAILALIVIIILWSAMSGSKPDPHMEALKSHLEHEVALLRTLPKGGAPSDEQCRALRASLAELDRLIKATPSKAGYSAILVKATKLRDQLNSKIQVDCPPD